MTTSSGRDGAAPASGALPGPADSTPLTAASDYVDRWTFSGPEPPGPGDNQALAINYEDHSELFAYEASFEVVTADEALNRNQAYALSSCTGCRTEAVAFQVVLLVGDVAEIGPRNEAVAVNRLCQACTTRSLATQTVLSVPEPPTAEQEVLLDALWARVEALESAVGSVPLSELRTRMAGLQAEIAAVLGARLVGGDAAVDVDDTPADGDATSDAGSGSSTTTAPIHTTTSGPDEPSTTTTELPASTTTTLAPTTTTTDGSTTTTAADGSTDTTSSDP